MEVIISFFALAVVLYVVGKLVALPFKIVKNLVISLITGAIAIWVVNLLGAGIEITFINAVIASVVVYILKLFF